MGALENITARIEKDAKKKAQQHIKEAKKEAKSVLIKAKKELEKEKKALEMETDKAIKIQRSRAMSEAKLETRKKRLSTKEEVISQAFKEANERLKNIPAQENEEYLRNAIKNAVGMLGNEVMVLCNTRDQQLVSTIASEIDPRISVSSEGIGYLGGAVIRAKDGSAQVDATFEGVMTRIKNELRKEVAEILFQGK